VDDDKGLDDVIDGEVVEDEAPAPAVEVEPSSEGCAPGEMGLVRRESTGLMSPEDLEQDIERREAMKTTVVRMTDPGKHWDQFGDNCRLNRHGAEAIAMRLGISVGPDGRPFREPQRGYEKDAAGREYYRWMYPYQAEFRGRKFGYIGIGDSRHKFFGTNFGKGPRLIDEVDEAQIQRLAQANAIVNCVGRFIDITTIKIDEFKSITGKEPPSKIAFKSGKSSTPPRGAGSKRQGTGSAPPPSKPASKEGGEGWAVPVEAPAMLDDMEERTWMEITGTWIMLATRVSLEYGVDAYEEFLKFKSGEHLTREKLERMTESDSKRAWLIKTLRGMFAAYPPKGGPPAAKADRPSENEPEPGEITDGDIPF